MMCDMIEARQIKEAILHDRMITLQSIVLCLSLSVSVMQTNEFTITER